MNPVTASVPQQAEAEAEVQAPSQTSSSLHTRFVENLMYKNDLQSYCQRLGKTIPVYQTAVEGCAHALRFTSTISIGKRIFTSPNTFSNRKSAEQDVAKLALQHLLNEDEANATNLRLYLRKLLCHDKTHCKMILNEFLVKIKMECAYETFQVEMSPPLFVSSLAINGICYEGEAGKNKKEAEQLVAFAAILSLLDDPTYASPISEVIKSKFNVCANLFEAEDISSTGDCSVTGTEFKTINSDALPLNQQFTEMSISVEEERGSEILVNKNKQNLVNSLPQTKKQDGGHGALDDRQGSGTLTTEAVTISRRSYVVLSSFSETTT